MADSSELKRKYIFFEIIGRAVNKTASIAERSFEVFSFASKLEVVYHDDITMILGEKWIYIQ